MIGPAAAHAQKYPIPTQLCITPLPPASCLPAARAPAQPSINIRVPNFRPAASRVAVHQSADETSASRRGAE
jgi:hypothetical protein